MKNYRKLIIAFPASILLFPLPFPLAPIGLLRPLPLLQSLLPALRPWLLRPLPLPHSLFPPLWPGLLLLTLYTPWLLPPFPECRSSLLPGLRRTLDLLLPRPSHPRLFLPSPLTRCGRPLLSPLLKVPADFLVARLVTIMLAA